MAVVQQNGSSRMRSVGSGVMASTVAPRVQASICARAEAPRARLSVVRRQGS